MPTRCRNRRSGGLLLAVALGLMAGPLPAGEKPGMMNRAYTGQAPQAAWTNAVHQRFVDRVLLIRDLEVLDSVAAWRVPAVIQRAGTLGRMEDPALRFVEGPVAGMAGRLDGVCAAVGATECVERSGFQLLAVVNRLDLARIRKDGMAAGAEVRFVYGHHAANGVPDVLMIVEFVLKAEPAWMLGQSARQWALLQEEGRRPEPQVEAALTKAESVRIRLEVAEPGAPGTWKFRQYDARGGCWTSAELTGEIAAVARYEMPLKDRTSKALADFVRRQSRAILSGKFALDATLRTEQASMPMNGEALTLSSDVEKKPEKREALRHALWLNTCTGCHGAETGNGLFQVRPGRNSVSGFLGGDPKGGVSTGYVAVVPKRRPGLSADRTEYRYNDLRRRHEFFDVVVRLSELRSDGRAWQQVLARLQRLQVSQVH